MQVWAVANQKGGVGKTTTAISLAGLLAEVGYRVLLVDLDPHGSMTSYFRYDPDELERSVYDLFSQTRVDAEQVRELILDTSHDSIKLIPASTALATLERKAVAQEGMGLQVAKALRHLQAEYDYVLIDSPPVLGVLMVNALAACSHLLVPVQTEFLALKGLERMVRTIQMINRARKNKLPFTIVPTFYDRRTQASVNSLRELHAHYPEHLSNAVVPVDTKFRNASLKGLVPSSLDAGSRGVHAYARLLRSLLEPREQE
ncbi:ParA family protein [Marinobacterium sediminicola]|uniref:Chromosome partitioning protein n=1 Tax=Marinobacterium sediminicola TaxID=518898 RepID=A0ABY1RYL3_9GAMM|nr:ParA family protein [Marinobacterium sediminicola]ULG68750.1 ParA family protein [Marinobacterium sediminicola]SMR73279.1 chromosome partitioning protein [Marinobacterium sediminicola]